MKHINTYINEKLKISKATRKVKHTLFPKTKDELMEMIKKEIKQNGNECSLNHIDVSEITNMSFIFYLSEFNGDISQWDVSNVTNMASMFSRSNFNNDSIYAWDVSNVEDMTSMFGDSKFNSDISTWNVGNVKNMDEMFANSNFDNDISKWNINKNCSITNIFFGCPIKEAHKPKFI